MPLLVLDSGDLVARDGKVADRAREGTEIKGELILKAVAHSGIDAMTPGDGDVALGLDWLTAQAETHGLPYVCANLKRDGEDVFLGWKVVEVGEVKVGVFGVTGNLETCEECEVTDAIAAATAAVAALQGEGAHQIIALSHQGVDDDVAGPAVDGKIVTGIAVPLRRLSRPLRIGPDGLQGHRSKNHARHKSVSHSLHTSSFACAGPRLLPAGAETIRPPMSTLHPCLTEEIDAQYCIVAGGGHQQALLRSPQ